MVGIVLAAGNALRLPNKLLLPLPNHSIVIQQAIDYAFSCCSSVRIVIAPNSPIPLVLMQWLMQQETIHNLKHSFIVQPVPEGPIQGARLAAKGIDDDVRVAIIWGDNVYPLHEAQEFNDRIGAVCRTITDKRAHQLARWDETTRKWMEPPSMENQLCLAGHVIVSARQLHESKEKDTVPFLNENLIPPYFAKSETDWHDVGTVTSYYHMWSKYLVERGLI